MAKNIDIPDGWEVKKLGEVVEVNNSKVLTETLEPLSISAGIGFVNQTEKFGRELSGKQYEKYIKIQKYDFAYNKGNSKKYPQGCIYLLKDREYAAIPNVFECFRFIGDNPFYYEQLFMSGYLNKQLTKLINTGVRNDGLLNINSENFFSCYIPVPPLDEQKKIADILSLWDKAIQQTKDLIAYKETQKKGLMQNLLTGKKRLHGFNEKWKTYTLKEVGQIITGKTPNTNKEEYYGNDILFITPTDINSKYTTKTERSLTKIGVKYSKFIPKHSVLVTCIASIGKNTINQEDCTINQQINAIIPNDSNYYEYLYYHLTFNTPYILTFAGKSATAIINKSTFEEIDITIPLLDEQKAIADILSKADEEINLLHKQLDLYTEQKKGLMQNLLTGKVRV